MSTPTATYAPSAISFLLPKPKTLATPCRGVAQVPKDRVMSGLREEMRGPPQHWIKPGEPDPVEEHRVGGLAKIK